MDLVARIHLFFVIGLHQEYTPLQVQEMKHKKKLLEENLSSLERQKEDIQREIWAQEVKNCQKLFQIEKRAKEYSEAVHIPLRTISSRVTDVDANCTTSSL